MKRPVCVPKYLSPAAAAEAIRRTIDLNPGNAVQRRQVMRTPVGRAGGPSRLSVVVGLRWPVTGVKLTVRFLDNPEAALRRRILGHMNSWSKTANIQFSETRGDAMVRIARLDSPEESAGYWSYVGTQVLGVVDQDEPTLNLDGFTMRTSEAEFKRVVRHEAGHTLGFEHEHMRSGIVKRIDRKKAFKYFDLTQGWSREETLEQVLTPLANASLMGTVESDPVSIMCYQLPGAIMIDGKSVPGGRDINKRDYAFAAAVYPKRVKTRRTLR
jgi:hypothetical protein